MTHKQAPIKDPIHDYIPSTYLERAIMDSSEFQRLRFVLQNSTAYLTYPSNVNTRFAHSVGVMHVAGELFLHSLVNAKKEDLECFLSEANTIFDQNRSSTSFKKYHEQWMAVDNHPAFSHFPYVGESISNLDEIIKAGKGGFFRSFIIDTLWQVVRIGALVHDIGHFPMSHVFEDALNGSHEHFDDVTKELSSEFEQRNVEYRNSLNEHLQGRIDINEENDQLHEIKGLHIFFGLIENEKFEDVLENNSAGISVEYYRFILNLAGNVLISNPSHSFRKDDSSKEFRLFSFLHSIFANDFIDADRLDYTMRDPHVSGVSMENVDVERIYDASILCREIVKAKDEESAGIKGEEYPIFNLCFHIKALSSIEMFFHQRFLLYREIVYHHNVSRMNALLIRIIRELLRIAIGGTKEYKDLQRVMADFCFYDTSRTKQGGSQQKFLPDNSGVSYDDSWLRTFLIICLKELKEIENFSDEADQYRNKQLISFLETFTERKVNNLYSVWKRESDFFQWVGAALERAKSDKKCNLDNDIQVRELVMFILQETKNPVWRLVKNIDNFVAKSTKKINEIDELSEIVILSSSAPPKIHPDKKDENYFVGGETTRVSLGNVAPYLHALKDVQAVTPSSSIFVFSEDIKSPANSGMKEHCIQILEECFYEYIVEVIDVYNQHINVENKT